MSTNARLLVIAEDMIAAHAQARACSCPADLALEDAYDVAFEIFRMRLGAGLRLAGRKIGMTNRRMWAQYGIDGPLWGYVYNRSLRAEGTDVMYPLAGLLEPKIEPEIVFGLRTVPGVGASYEEMLECIEWVAHGFEIVHSHVPGWGFTAAQAVADFGLHASLLVGTRVRVAELRDPVRALREFRISLFCNGEQRDHGTGASVLDSPLNALEFLVNALADAPKYPPLQPWEVVTTGTLTAALPVLRGETWHTQIEGIELDGMRVRFE
jgi:2-keto-4-pentenoate hydratase